MVQSLKIGIASFAATAMLILLNLPDDSLLG